MKEEREVRFQKDINSAKITQRFIKNYRRISCFLNEIHENKKRATSKREIRKTIE